MNEADWIQQAKSRGFGGALRLMLDALEPVGPLAAQLIWVAQPTLRLFGTGEIWGHIAHALEEPGGIDRLRALLDHQDTT
jgi:hypothetical protein